MGKLKDKKNFYKILILTIFTSFCSMIYESVLVQTVTMISPQVILAQTLTLGFYLLGTGVGAFFSSRVKESKLISTFIRIELLLALSGIVFIPLVFSIYYLIKFRFYNLAGDLYFETWKSQLLFYISVQPISFFLGSISGFELPILIRLAHVFKSKNSDSILLAFNYFGAVFAVFLSTFYFLENLDILGTVQIVVFLNLCLAVMVIVFFRLSKMWSLLVLGAFCVLLIFVRISPEIYQYHLKSRYVLGLHFLNFSDLVRTGAKWIGAQPEVFRKKTRYQYADFVHHSHLGGYSFYLDGQIQIAPSWTKTYHESLVHIPIQYFSKIPKNVLIFGGGDGGVAAELLKYGSAVEKITLVEIDQTILAMAKSESFFSKINHGSLDHPKVHIVIDDAISFLRRTLHSSYEKYDAIIIDFPLPQDYDTLKLYSLDFYQMVLSLLDKEGYISIDAGLFSDTEIENDKTSGNKLKQWNETFISSLFYAGFRQIIPYRSSESFVTARRTEEGWVNTKIKNYGVHYEVLDQKLLTESVKINLGVTPNLNAVNRIFKPKLYYYPNVKF